MIANRWEITSNNPLGRIIMIDQSEKQMTIISYSSLASVRLWS
jgi:hypothetical protein